MPELPEVETTRQGIKPYVVGQTIKQVLLRQTRLRWPIPEDLGQCLMGAEIKSVNRRAKYLLLEVMRAKASGHLLIHLGMSGSLRVVDKDAVVAKHDHVDIVLSNGCALRYTDPRRFGAILWIDGKPEDHQLLVHLGPEPLTPAFNGERLFQCSRKRKVPLKPFIMDSKVVVGVGNIYANEALFMAGIDPQRQAGSISRKRYQLLADCIQQVLSEAIRQGGTTLRDFVGGDGKPGYFKQSLKVYGRGGQSCDSCGAILHEIRLGQRSTVFCRCCQS